MKIEVEHIESLWILEDGVFRCQHPYTEAINDWLYHPTPQQIDDGTDNDEEMWIIVCLDCGEDLLIQDVAEKGYDDGDY